MTTELSIVQDTNQSVSTQSLVFDPDAINNMMRLAEMMSKAVVTIPKHLAGKPSDCLAIVMQAAQFRMNPYAVAQATHLVNGALGYEGKLVNAVVQNSGAIRGRFHYEYKGEGDKVECRVGAVIAGESDITWGQWLSAASVTTKNSPLWKTNPKQQLGYLQVKNWARQYAPGAILGVYSTDELDDSPIERTVTATIVDETPPPATRTAAVKDKLKGRAKAAPEPAPVPAGPTLDQVLCAIAAADSPEELTAIKPRINTLGPEDRAAAIEAGKARSAALSTPPPHDPQTGEILDAPAPESTTSEFERVRYGIETAPDLEAVREWLEYSTTVVLRQSEKHALQHVANIRQQELEKAAEKAA